MRVGLLPGLVKEVQMKNRREFLKKVAYVAPVIVTLKAVPAFAGSGSGYTSDGRKRRRK